MIYTTPSINRYFPALSLRETMSPNFAYEAFVNLSDVGATQNQIKAVTNLQNFNLVDLLPISNSARKIKELPDLIKKYVNFVQIAKEALFNFDLGKMHQFNPTVGENACQIRAAMMLEILKNKRVSLEVANLLEKTDVIIQKLTPLVNSVTLHKSFSKDIKEVESFQSYVKGQEASFQVSEEIFVIISCYLLTISKKAVEDFDEHGIPMYKETIQPKLLSDKFVATFANDLIRQMQIKLSALSVQMVQRIAAQELVKGVSESSTLVFGNYEIADKLNRAMTPFYASTHLLIDRFESIPFNQPRIELRIHMYVKGNKSPYKMMSLGFEVKKGSYKFTAQTPTHQTFSKGAMFIYINSIQDREESEADYKAHVIKLGPRRIILGGAADHPQYGTNHHEAIGNQCAEDRIQAVKDGTCVGNPRVLIQHVHTGNKSEYLSSTIMRENVSITQDTTTRELYSKLREQTGFPESRIRLIYGNKVLVESDSLLSELDLKPGSTVIALCSVVTPTQHLFPSRYFILS